MQIKPQRISWFFHVVGLGDMMILDRKELESADELPKQIEWEREAMCEAHFTQLSSILLVWHTSFTFLFFLQIHKVTKGEKEIVISINRIVVKY